MKKVLKVILGIIVVLALVIVLLPQISTKDTCSYEAMAGKYAQGKFVTVDGKKVHYIEKGSGKPLILIHGFLYNTVMWEQSVDALSTEFRVLVIDLWGWGYSERLNPSEYSFDRYAKQVTGFMDALQIEKATLIGQSMGGGISVYVAANHSERIDRLILVAPAVIPYPKRPAGKVYQLPFVGEFLNAIPGDSLMVNSIKTAFFYDQSKVTDAYAKKVLQPMCIKGSYDGMMYLMREVLKDPYVEKEANMLTQLNIPTMIIHGRQDIAVPLDRSQKMNKMWKSSKLEIFEEAGHTPHEEYPEKFNQLALNFLMN